MTTLHTSNPTGADLPHSPSERFHQLRPWAAASVGTMCSALPAFLVGALSVQIRDELNLSLTELGVAIASSFAVAGSSSPVMGRVAQNLGPRRGFQIGLTGTATAMLSIAALGHSLLSLSLALAFAGLCNSLNQPSANLLLSNRIRPGRLGLALAVKQSGMPAATLLGGAAVPLVALTIGWRWAFVIAAALAIGALALQPPNPTETGAETERPRPKRSETTGSAAARPDMATTLLVLYAAVGLLGAAAATAVANLLTSAATESGLNPGTAGWLLSIGSATGIASRMYQGWTVDHNGVLPIQRVVWLFAFGALGMAAMTVHTPLAYVAAVIPFFAGGWAWPGLFNLSVIRNNPSAPAAATGISQMGVFIGAGLGPLVGGTVAQAYGYVQVWVVVGIALAIASGLAMFLRSRVRASLRPAL